MTRDAKAILAPLLVVILALPPIAKAATPDKVELLATGKKLLAEKCAQCHAITRTDASPLQTAPPFRDLAGKYPLEQLEEALAEGIVTGHSEMPEFVFSPDEIAAILGYIESISAPATPK